MFDVLWSVVDTLEQVRASERRLNEAIAEEEREREDAKAWWEVMDAYKREQDEEYNRDMDAVFEQRRDVIRAWNDWDE